MSQRGFKIAGMCLSLLVLGFTIAYWYRPDITFRNQADGFAYYLPLRSYLYDGDADFSNENKAFENTYHASPYFWKQLTKKHLPVYHYSVGPSILWSPFILLGTDTYKTVKPSYLQNEDIIKGFSAKDFEILRFASYFYGSFALVFTFLFLMRLYPSLIVAGISVVLTVFTTPFFYYFRYQPLMSHVLSAFAVSLFLYLWILQYGKQVWYRYIYLGIMVGVVSLVRWQDCIVAIVLIGESLYFFRKEKKIELRYFISHWIVFLLSAIVAFMPQIIFWKNLYGEFLLIPQGSNYFSINIINILSFIFSFHHGLITWSPIILFSIIGLVIYVLKRSGKKKLTKEKVQIISFITIIILSIIINGSLTDWHGSDSFGARRMTAIFPLFAAGIYILLMMSKARLTAVLVCLFVLFSVYNVLFADIFFLQKVDHYSNIYPSEVIDSIREQYFRYK